MQSKHPKNDTQNRHSTRSPNIGRSVSRHASHRVKPTNSRLQPHSPKPDRSVSRRASSHTKPFNNSRHSPKGNYSGGEPAFTPVGPGVPPTFRPIAEDCGQVDMWPEGEQIGEGAAGHVYLTRRCDDSCCVLKIQKADASFIAEVTALQELQPTGVVPRLHAAWTCKGMGYIAIEKLKDCSFPYFPAEEVKNALEIIETMGWLHVDTHACNFMCNDAGALVLIDFGHAVKRTSKGDEQTYPEHPLSSRLNKDATYRDLKLEQDLNFRFFFAKYLKR